MDPRWSLVASMHADEKVMVRDVIHVNFFQTRMIGSKTLIQYNLHNCYNGSMDY